MFSGVQKGTLERNRLNGQIKGKYKTIHLKLNLNKNKI